MEPRFWVAFLNTLEIVVGGVLLQFVTGLTRETATPILWALVDKLTGLVPEESIPVQACYDMVNHKPSPDYLRIYLQLKEEFAQLGLMMNP